MEKIRLLKDYVFCIISGPSGRSNFGNREIINLRILFGVSLIVLSCNTNKTTNMVKFQDGRQLLTVNTVKRNGEKLEEFKIKRTSSDSISVGTELLIKIFLNGTALKIVDAFVDCETVLNPSVDTTTYNVSGCSKGLIIENDTILIGFKPTETGMHTFPEITILTKDKEKTYRTYKYSFEYFVFPGQHFVQ